MNEVFENPVAQDMVLRETINGQETLRLKTALNGETGED
jgi:hypothetical protein